MNRRNSILALAAVVLVATAIVVGIVVSRDDDGGNGDTTTTEASPAEAVPTFDAPGAAAPGEQDQTNEDTIDEWSLEDINDALANPRTPPPEAIPNTEPPGASTAPGAAGGQTAPSVEPTEPGRRAAAAQRCTKPARVPARAGYLYARDCYRGPFGVFPVRATGVLFFKQPGAAQASQGCTATVAVTQIGQTPGNESVIVTAGHCMGLTPNESSTGGWEPFTSAFWVSAPSFAELLRTRFPNEAAFDRWLANNVWFPYTYAGSTVPVGYIPGGWKNGAGFRYDFGAIVMQPLGGTTILRKVGGLGVNMTGAGANKKIVSYGFPADKPYDGKKLFYCTGKSKVGDRVTTAGTLTAIGIGCDMTGGSSGGPWLRVGDPGRFIVSVNSYGPSGAREIENVMFGPNLNGDHWGTFVSARDHR